MTSAGDWRFLRAYRLSFIDMSWPTFAREDGRPTLPPPPISVAGLRRDSRAVAKRRLFSRRNDAFRARARNHHSSYASQIKGPRFVSGQVSASLLAFSLTRSDAPRLMPHTSLARDDTTYRHYLGPRAFRRRVPAWPFHASTAKAC